MALHLLKLCVGVDSVEDLAAHIAHRLAVSGAAVTWHITRMVPKRIDELIDGGSLYWVIRGQVQARQVIVGIEPFTDHEGIGRCRILLDPTLVTTRHQPKRPFQGWRYLKGADAPADRMQAEEGADDLPPDLSRVLEELGVI
ncbi:DUF1489 domain-containing protein [Jiella sp. MQZ9-1]|uniref:DUF1489 domain-containing protein n=1 Tax=Jiella flava TaxID=2816857 RepID=A0A939JWE6_9HYPH|nr:DUF1489 domain-containing protein [Jiella flava]MBO0662226.1 DUF1489 domain-containing protein [Jiella flava]MCD2470943.1 DUF1489 domain-containing protein [Jiella flava]